MALEHGETAPLTILATWFTTPRAQPACEGHRHRGRPHPRHDADRHGTATRLRAILAATRARGCRSSKRLSARARRASRDPRPFRDGYHPVSSASRHVEVRGSPRPRTFDIVQNEADVRALGERARFGVASQTTQPLERVQRLVAMIRQRFPSRRSASSTPCACRPSAQKPHRARPPVRRRHRHRRRQQQQHERAGDPVELSVPRTPRSMRGRSQRSGL